jgi:hypothetical protein
MESTKPCKNLFAKLRPYEKNLVMSFLPLEFFIDKDKDLINRNFYRYFKANYKKLILNYILFKKKKEQGQIELNKTPLSKFHKKFLKNIFLEKHSNQNQENIEKDLLSKQKAFESFLESILLKRFIDFAAYKNEGGYFNNLSMYHFQNLFDYQNNWFCSELSDKSFNVYATVYYDETSKNAPFLNENFFEKNNIKSEEKNEFKIRLNLKDIKKIIDSNQDILNYSFKEIPDNWNTSYLYAIPEIYLNKYEISGIKKFLVPAEKDPKFFEKVFQKNQNWNFIFDSFTINNMGSGYTCPLKTAAVYIHDEKELNQQDLDLLQVEFHNEKDLLNFLSQQKKFHDLNEKYSQLKKDEFLVLQHIVEEISGNEKLIFYEFDTMNQRFAGRNLKLFAWITIDPETQKFFDLTKLVHFGRHLIVKPLNANRKNYYDKNIDFKSIHFFGGVVHI